MNHLSIGLLGGTFDPIHLGHLIMAEHSADELQLDQVLFLPAQSPPHKRDKWILPAHHRAEMVKLAISDNAHFSFSDLDLRSGHPSYTSELVTRVGEIYPNARLFFIAGADSLRDFPTWHAPETILAHATLAIARRPGIVISDEMMSAVPGMSSRVNLFESPLIDISSSAIQERIRHRQSIKYLVPDVVDAYIRQQNLYR